MATEVADLVGRHLANERYEVVAKLGEGGMGFVYKARDHNLDCDVVIKIPRPAMLQNAEFKIRFMRELRSLVKLSAPHIVKIIDIGEQQGVPFAVMEFLSGGSLESRQRRSRDGRVTPLSPKHLLDWLEPVAQALDFIHAQGYIHRDIKPANILFDAHGNAYVGDFGVAKVMHAGEDLKRTNVQTQDGMVLGTAHYMAPEMIMGQKFDGRVDQYALAATVYEMVAGQVPISGPNPRAIMVKQTTHKPVPLCELDPSIPQSLSAAVDQGLAKNPRQRFSDCASFARAALKGLKPLAPAPRGAGKGGAVNPPPAQRIKSSPQQGGAATDRVEQARIETKGMMVHRSSREVGPQGTMLESTGGRKKSGLGGLLLVGGFLALLAAGTFGAMWFFNRPPNQLAVNSTPVTAAPTNRGTEPLPVPVQPRLGLAAIGDVTLEAGGKERIRVQVERHACAGEPIDLEVLSLPARVSAEKQTLAGGQNEATLELIADLSAERAINHKVKVVARCQRLNLVTEREFQIAVVVPSKPSALAASLKLSPVDAVSLVAGGMSGTVHIKVERQNCGNEPVVVEISDLPDKVTATKQPLFGFGEITKLDLKAEPMAPPVSKHQARVVARIDKLRLAVQTDLLVSVQPPAPPALTASLKLSAIRDVTIAAGGASQTLRIQVVRQNCAGEPVQLEIIGLPKSLTPSQPVIRGNTDTVDVDFKAGLNELVVKHKVKVIARITKGNLEDEKNFVLTIRPLALKLHADSGSFQLEENENKSLTVKVADRDGYEGQLQLQVGGQTVPLTRVKVGATPSIPASQNSAQVQLTGVSFGEEDILIRTRLGDREVAEPLRIKVRVTNLGKSFKLAESYLNSGKFAEAIKAYDVVIKANPRRFEALVGRAEALATTGSYQKARDDLKEAKDLKPGDPLPIALSGYIRFKEANDKDYAQKMAEDALRCKGGEQCGWAWYVAYLAYDAQNIHGPRGDASLYKKTAYQLEPRLKNLQGK